MFELLGFSAVCFLLDQVSKHAVRSASLSPLLSAGNLVRLRSSANHNRFYRLPAFRAVLVATWLFAAASAVALHSRGEWFQSSSSIAGLGCALGGAAGNLFDIIRRHYVLDFIDLGWWPVFNLADIAIIGGLLIAFWR